MKHLLPSALILTVVGGSFASIGIWLIGGGPEENTFKMIWVGFSTLIVVAGISLVIKYLRSLNQEIRVEADETDVAIRTTKRGRIYHERSFPRSSVTGVRAAAGKDYYQSMKQVALIVGEKSEKIPEWVDAEEADEFVKKVNVALGFSNG